MSKTFFLVSYDIANDRRRTKIAKVMKGYGERVQYSVFECQLAQKHEAKMVKELEKVMDQEADSIRIYRLCRECVPKVMALGQAKPPADEPEVYIV